MVNVRIQIDKKFIQRINTNLHLFFKGLSRAQERGILFLFICVFYCISHAICLLSVLVGDEQDEVF